MTTAASVAFGISPSSGASSSMVASAAPAVTSDAFCDCPPAERTTAVCAVLLVMVCAQYLIQK